MKLGISSARVEGIDFHKLIQIIKSSGKDSLLIQTINSDYDYGYYL